jgi:aspartokinase
MVTVSHVVNKIINDNIYLQEAISRKIASHGAVAKQIKPIVEEELRREVTHFAIVAAIRRYSENVNVRFKDIKFNANASEVNLKTNVIDINVLRTPSLFDKLKRIYDIIKFEKGDILHIIYGRNSATIVTNERYKEQICNFLQNEKIFDIKEKLVSLSFTIGKDLVKTPGVLFLLARNFAWENINIIEVISIDLEITFIVNERDAVRGYNALERLIN